MLYTPVRPTSTSFAPATAAALQFSVLIALVALAFLRALKGRPVGAGTLCSALQTTLIGDAAAAAAYTLAHLLNRG